MRNVSYALGALEPRTGGGSFFRWPQDRAAQVRLQFLFCGVATLIDAAGTFIHLVRGAEELNPVWAGLIVQIGAGPAMSLRLIVGLGLLGVLLACWHRRLAQLGLRVVVAAFIPLTLYHLFLFLYLPWVS